MFQYPFGNQQQLNLDWFLGKFKDLSEEWTEKEASIDGALQDEIDRAEAALSDVFAARDAAVAAKNDALQAKADALTAAANAATYWQNAANSAQSAAASAVNALNAADSAGADATQVAADKATVAADKAAVAADKATVAADKATVAADKAAVAQDKADTDDIKDTANAAALRAEGWTEGTQNGTPVSAESPYYEHNAAYYFNNIPVDYSKLSDKVDSIENQILTENGSTICALQNGTLINPNNANAVCCSNYIPVENYDTVEIFVTKPNEAGYVYVYGYAIYDENLNRLLQITDLTPDYKVIKLYNEPAAKYIRVVVAEQQYPNSIFNPLRTTDFQDYEIIIKNYSKTNIVKLENSIGYYEYDFTSALRNYTVGDYIFVNDIMYEVSANISRRSALVENTNIVKKKLCDIIKSL